MKLTPFSKIAFGEFSLRFKIRLPRFYWFNYANLAWMIMVYKIRYCMYHMVCIHVWTFEVSCIAIITSFIIHSIQQLKRQIENLLQQEHTNFLSLLQVHFVILILKFSVNSHFILFSTWWQFYAKLSFHYSIPFFLRSLPLNCSSLSISTLSQYKPMHILYYTIFSTN